MEEQPLTASDAPAPGLTRTGRAVALARLLLEESTQLLQLYEERETFLLDNAPDSGRMVSLSPEVEESSTEEQVQLLHSALRRCLALLHCVIQKEEEEWGKLEVDYETLKLNVRTRLENLLYTTRNVLGNETGTLEVTPDHQNNEEVDSAGGGFALKLWTYRVLKELIHWADHAAKTLHVLHTEREGTEEI